MNKRQFQRNLLTVFVSIMTSVGYPNLCSAQSTTQGSILEEIIVTAQKRETSAQQTPIALSTFSGEIVDRAGVRDVFALSDFVPNMAIGEFANNVIINIRGVQTNNLGEEGDPGVAFHMDGVYIARPRGANAIFHDIERIEVLRGPQGTLYGRNSTAGSVNVITKKPTNEFEAGAEVLYGNEDHININGYISGPIIKERLLMRGAILYDKHDGYSINDRVNTNIDNADDADDIDIRISALMYPLEDMTLSVVGSYYKTDKTGPQFSDLLNPEDPSDPRVYSVNTQPVYEGTVASISTQLDHEFGWGTVTYIGNWRSDEADESTQDMDGLRTLPILPPFLPPLAVFGPFNVDTDSTSHELRLASSDSDSRWSWLLGGFYFDEDSELRRILTFVPGALELDFIQPTTNTESIAVFGELIYDINEQLSLVGGLRYTDEEKLRGAAGTTINLIGAPIGPPGITTIPNNGMGEFDSIDWKAALRWQQNDNSLHYLNIATGFKSGGFNNGNPGSTYEPEDVISYELGTKNQFFNDRLRLNGSFFYMDYTDLQVSAVAASPDGTLGLLTRNAAEATIWGIEIEGTALITDATEVDFSIGYLDATFDQFQTDDPVLTPTIVIEDLSDNQLPKAPEWSIHIGAQHIFNLGEWGTLIPRVDFSFIDEHFLREFNGPLDQQESFTRTNLSLTYTSRDERFWLQGFVKNLEDEDVKNNILNIVTVLGVHVDPPRTYGIRMGYRFN